MTEPAVSPDEPSPMDAALQAAIVKIAAALPADNRVALAALAYALAGAADAIKFPDAALFELLRVALEDTRSAEGP